MGSEEDMGSEEVGSEGALAVEDSEEEEGCTIIISVGPGEVELSQ